MLELLRFEPALERADHDRQEGQGRDHHCGDPDRGADSHLADQRVPITSSPAIATITIKPAASTAEPEVAADFAAASRVESPAAACSR